MGIEEERLTVLVVSRIEGDESVEKIVVLHGEGGRDSEFDLTSQPGGVALVC